MFSARAVSRAFRTPLLRTFSRSIPQRTPLASVWRSSALVRQPPLVAPFSTTIRAFDRQGSVDDELCMRIESEIDLESEVKRQEDVSDGVKEFLENSPFRIIDKPGQEEVELVRKFGDETIRVVFSISDFNTMSDENAAAADDLGDEDDVDDSSRPDAKESEDEKPSATDDTYDSGYDDEASFPARVNVIIEKPGQGALQIESIAQDGMIVIENVFYHKNAALATAQTAEADYERRGIYAGPPFGNLDQEVQVLFERYLEERGINTALALFIPDYIDFKEQKEYMAWLENLKGFVSA